MSQMTKQDRITTYNRWKAYVQIDPRRYQIVHHWQKNTLIITLQEFVRSGRFRQDPFSGIMICPLGYAYDWDIVEELPPWESERAAA